MLILGPPPPHSQGLIVVKMSWFNASHLSSFAKQALSSAQKSIDRVLDIKEDDQWGDTTVMPYDGKYPPPTLVEA